MLGILLLRRIDMSSVTDLRYLSPPLWI